MSLFSTCCKTWRCALTGGGAALVVLLMTIAVLPECAWAQGAGTGPSDRSIGAASPLPPRAPRPDEQLHDERPFFPGIEFDDAITAPDRLLRFPLGQHPASGEEIATCMRTWADESPRAVWVDYATSHQGRQLGCLIISSPDNITRLDTISANQQQLADPRQLRPREARRMLRETPGVAWLGYGIHGDEASGPDAALAAAYYLVAAAEDDPFVRGLLDRTVIIVDPNLNPDGRARFLNDVRQRLSQVPDVDDQSSMNHDHWPGGRMNHYLFDLNRDWIFATQPETVGRIALFNRWYPQLFVDAHEMGGQETYFFTPSVEPINPHYPMFGRRWWDTFAHDHARAFDEEGWTYYTADIFDDWYPGYSNSWAAYRGAIGILYEQAGVIWHGVLRPEGRVLTYRQTVRQQLTSTLANLRTFLNSLDEVKSEWLEARRSAIEPEGRYASRAWAIEIPEGNTARRERFLDLMALQGIEVHALTDPLTVRDTIDRFGRLTEERTLPAGTLIVHNRQPEAHLVAAMFEFDTAFDPAFLAEEREDIVRRGDSRIYDITSWAIPLIFDLPAWTFSLDEVPSTADRLTPFAEDLHSHNADSAAGIDRRDARQGWVIEGDDDRVPTLAAHLLHEGVRVRLALRPFSWAEQRFARGSLVIAREDHLHLRDDLWVVTLDRVTREHMLPAIAIDTGHGPGEAPDLGGRRFRLLQPARLAVIGGEGVDPYDYGSMRHLIDHRARLSAAWLDSGRLGRSDLRRYDVIVLPASSFRGINVDDLMDWVKDGGTLIATGSSATRLARAGTGSEVRLLRDVPGSLESYQVQILREIAGSALPEAGMLNAHEISGLKVVYPWDGIPLGTPGADADERQRRDVWNRQFSPNGAITAARVDDEHWLTVGLHEALPVSTASTGGSVLMAAAGVEAPIRHGLIEPRVVPAIANPDSADDSDARDVSEEGEENAEAQPTEPLRLGWSVLPGDHTLRLRAGGLMWPETASRLANSAVVTRERIGRGQLILIAGAPAFRGATPGMERVLMNAIVFGPSLGAPPPLRPRP